MKAPAGRLIAGAVTAAVVVVLAVALRTLDSPATERRQRLDQRRVSDLRAIAGELDSYFLHHGRLPPELNALGESNGGDRFTDPVDGEPYGYRLLDDERYELCATFEFDSRRRPATSRWGDGRFHPFDRHPAGRHCFTVRPSQPERRSDGDGPR